MSRKIIRRPEARRDVARIAKYLAEASGSTDLSDRFIEAFQETLQSLADMPGLGSPWEGENPEFAGMRYRPVSGFANHLIFYRYTERQIEIIRVLHGARDLRIFFE